MTCFLARPNRRPGLFAIVTGLVIAVLAGCARTPRVAGTLRLSSKSDPSKLDPALAYDTTSINFVRILYRGLVDYDDKAHIVDEVAQSHSISADGKEYRFVLRPNVRFHSGRRVVAADFRYAIERVLDPATASDGLTFYQVIEGADAWISDRRQPASGRKLKHLRGIEVQGNDVVIFHLRHPDATFLNVLALPFAYAVPQEWVEKLEREGKTLSDNPNGCGPFKLESWRHNAWLHLVKNTDYFRPTLPRCDRIEVEIGGDENLAQMRFELGDLDIQSDIPPADFARLMHDPHWAPLIMHAPMMDVRYLCMNTEMAPFNDVRVRRAFNYAIDRRKLLPIRGGRISVANGILPPGVPGYNPSLRGYSYNPAKARQLLREVGGKPISLTLAAANVDDYDKMAESIQQDLKDVDVEVHVEVMSYAELKTLAGKRGQMPLCLLGWLQDYPDPSNYLDALFNSNKITAVASLNRSFYHNPRVDSLLNVAGIELDTQKRLGLYRQAEQLIMNDAPWACLYHTERYVVRQPWVSGYKLHPMWSARYEYISVDGR